MNFLWAALSLAPLQAVTIDEREILLGELPARLGLTVAMEPAAYDHGLTIVAEQVEPARIMAWAATAAGYRLEPDGSNFRLVRANKERPLAEPQRAFLAWIRPYRDIAISRSFSQIVNQRDRLQGDRERILARQPDGWQTQAATLARDLAPYQTLAESPALMAMVRHRGPLSFGKTALLPIAPANQAELASAAATALGDDAPIADLRVAYRIEPSRFRFGIAGRVGEEVRQASQDLSVMVFARGRVELGESIPMPPTPAAPRQTGDDLQELFRRVARLTKTPLVVETVRELQSGPIPESTEELRLVLESESFQFRKEQGAWIGWSPATRDPSTRLPLRRIREIERAGGLADLDQMAALAADLADGTASRIRQARAAYSLGFRVEPLQRALPALRAYHSLPTDAKKALLEGNPLELKDLRPEAQNQVWAAIRDHAEPDSLAKLAVELRSDGNLPSQGLSFHLSQRVEPAFLVVTATGPKLGESAEAVKAFGTPQPVQLRHLEFRFGYSVDKSLLYPAMLIEARPAGSMRTHAHLR